MRTTGTTKVVYHTDRNCKVLAEVENVGEVNDEQIEKMGLRKCQHCDGSADRGGHGAELWAKALKHGKENND